MAEDTPSLQKGTRWHSVFEALYQHEDHPQNDDLVKAFVDVWDDLDAVAVERPFLFRHESYVVGGVIDLVAGDGVDTFAVDHKVSTGQYMSTIPMMMAREQLGVYTYALRQAGVAAAGGVLSQVKFQSDPDQTYIRSLAVSDGIEELPDSDAWGYTLSEGGRLVRALLYDNGKVFRVEREYVIFGEQEPVVLVDDLVSSWSALYGEGFRIRGPHCGYCSYLQRCNEDAATGTPPPAIEIERLHPELFRRLVV